MEIPKKTTANTQKTLFLQNPHKSSFLAISTKRHFWLAVPPARRGSLYYEEGGSMEVEGGDQRRPLDARVLALDEGA